MESIALLVFWAVGSVMTGIGFLTSLLTVVEDKIIAWGVLVISVITLTGGYWLFSVCSNIGWINYFAWPWITGVILGWAIVAYSNYGESDDTEEQTAA